MKVYENIEAERDRIQDCIKKFGWTSDHNLDWFADCVNDKGALPVFVEFNDNYGLLVQKLRNKYRIWSDPLSPVNKAPELILEFVKTFLGGEIKEIWCDDVSRDLRLSLEKDSSAAIGGIYYSLDWPVLDMEKYDPGIPGGHFKDMRNARNKFFKEHKVEIANSDEVQKDFLHKIVDDWKKSINKRDDVYDFKYHNAIDNHFRGFKTARIMIVDGKPAGINAGYEVINKPGRFGGIIGIHDYSFSDNGTILWLEDLEWIKKAGYKEMDMQGSEDDGGLKFKMQFNPVIERKTDTFLIMKK